MAFPIVAAVNGGSYGATFGTSHTINLPAPIPAGNLLLVFFACISDDPTAATINTPSGWTQLFQGSCLYDAFACFYKVAAGDEGASITITTSEGVHSAHTTYRITDYSGVPVAAGPHTSTNGYPDPPSLTTGWGAVDTLWFAVVGFDDTGISSWPANYGDTRSDHGSGYRYANVSTCRRELNAASENPGAFTLGNVGPAIACTVAVKPVIVTGAYKDIPARFRLWVQTFQDVSTRFRLWVQAFQDAATRFRLWVGAHQDIATRFSLNALNYQDIATRFKLAVRAYKDIATRFTVIARAYKDVATRFKLNIQAYADISTRFRLLPPVTHEDVSTRFYLYQPTWKSLQILEDIAALEATVAGLELKPKAHFEI